MNPILLYPQSPSEAKFYQQTAEDRGTEIIQLSQKMLEKMDDYFFGMQLHHIRSKGKKVSRERVMGTINKIIAESNEG